MRRILYTILGLSVFAACTKIDEENPGIAEISSKKAPKESPVFMETEISSVSLGGEGAAEISAYDPGTRKLFVVNNASDLDPRIDVLDLSNPALPVQLSSISILPFGGAVNSVSVKNGMLAAAIESDPKQDPGKVVVFRTTNYDVLAERTVGALPDMVTFSPDGRYILTANEGEPDDDYVNDPEGSVSIIDVRNGFSVTTRNFAAFAGQVNALKKNGLRIFGPNASFAQDIEPEYIAVSANSKTAWVSLQENNAIARIDIPGKQIEAILPLGFKDYNTPGNAMDLSDKDNINGNFRPWPVKGMFQPDGLAVHPENGTPFVYSANEGDARDYDGFSEEFTLDGNTALLDPNRFPNAADLVQEAQLGRLKLTNTLGDTDGDGDFDELYSFGARSISVWNGRTGQLVFDSRNELDRRWSVKSNFDDKRSDDKGAEPETLVIGRVGNRNLLFVALERADAFVIYDVTNPVKPKFRQWIQSGDAPEGILFIPADDSPTGKSLVVVSSEGDGTVRVYTTDALVQ